jgi:hypothetical protein
MSRSHLLRKAKAWLVDQCFQRGLDCEGNKELLVARWGRLAVVEVAVSISLLCAPMLACTSLDPGAWLNRACSRP